MTPAPPRGGRAPAAGQARRKPSPQSRSERLRPETGRLPWLDVTARSRHASLWALVQDEHQRVDELTQDQEERLRRLLKGL